MTTPISTTDVARVSGASHREIDYWCRRGYVPGQEALLGSGNPRVWTAEQLEWVADLAYLIRYAGLTVQGAATALEFAHQDADGYWHSILNGSIHLTWRRPAPAEVPA